MAIPSSPAPRTKILFDILLEVKVDGAELTGSEKRELYIYNINRKRALGEYRLRP